MMKLRKAVIMELNGTDKNQIFYALAFAIEKYYRGQIPKSHVQDLCDIFIDKLEQGEIDD